MINLTDVTKVFKPVTAISSISLAIEKGEIFGYLGPNGAGKTTTINCMLNFMKPASGKIEIDGFNMQSDAYKVMHKIGVISAENVFFPNLSGRELFQLVEQIKGKSENLKSLIEDFDFNPSIKAKNLSTGNAKKLSIIIALMNKPEILILDEPTLGLDPLIQKVFFNHLIKLKQEGVTIFFSSHNLFEVEKICDRVGIIKKGKLVAIEKLEELHLKQMHHIRVDFSDEQSKVFEGLNAEITVLSPKSYEIIIKGDIDPFLKFVSRYDVLNISINQANLEEIFMEYYK